MFTHLQKTRFLISKIAIQRIRNLSLSRRLVGAILKEDEIPLETLTCIILKDQSISIKYCLSLLNSSLLNYYTRIRFNHMHIEDDTLDFLPIVRATPDQQAPLISLVDAIIAKKKEYHSISQNVEDYIRFEDCEIVRLEDFIKDNLVDFSVLSSVKMKNDNFDFLRLKIENNEVIINYGIKRKVEEYEFDEDEEQGETKGKYILEWHEAGRGKIKNKEAIEFLTRTLEGIKNFSKAKQKSIWQKIADVKIPEFSQKVRNGFTKYKSAVEKAKKLDEEITKIDRAIDRLVYDLYGLTEDEIKVVEKSVWGERFEEMYSKLLSKEDALELARNYGGIKND